MVETAFLASTTAMLFLINFYFPVGPLLRMLFPLPTALAYLRWHGRAAWMSVIVTQERIVTGKQIGRAHV